MTRTSILLDTELLLQLKQTARTNGKTLAAVIREALQNYLGQQETPPRRLSFTGIGKGKLNHVSEEGETIIRAALSEYLTKQETPPRFSFIAAGRSGKGNLSEDVEKILRQNARRRRK